MISGIIGALSVIARLCIPHSETVVNPKPINLGIKKCCKLWNWNQLQRGFVSKLHSFPWQIKENDYGCSKTAVHKNTKIEIYSSFFLTVISDVSKQTENCGKTLITV
jgi:hypothetical protein